METRYVQILEMYKLLQNNFTVLSTETITEIGATITTHNEQVFKDHIVGALKLNTFFLDKQFQLNSCAVIIHVWWISYDIIVRVSVDFENIRTRSYQTNYRNMRQVSL